MAVNIYNTKFANAKVGDTFLYQRDKTVWFIGEIDSLDCTPVWAYGVDGYDDGYDEEGSWFSVRDLQLCVPLPAHNSVE